MSAFRKTWREDAWVRPYLARYKGILVLAILLSVVAYVFAAALMFTSGYMISLAASLPLTVLALHLPSIFVRIFGVGKPVAQYFERLASHDWVLRMTSSLRERLYIAIERSGSTPLGRTLSVFASDIEHTQDLYLRTIFPLITMFVMYAIIVIVMGFFSIPMAMILLLSIGIVLIILPLWSVAANGLRIAKRQSLSTEMYADLTEDVIGVADWRLSGRRSDFVNRTSGDYEQRFEALHSMQSFNRKCSIATRVVFAIAICAVFFWAGFVFNGFDSSNWIAAFVLCAFPLLEVFAPASEAALGFAKHECSIKNLNAITNKSTSSGTAFYEAFGDNSVGTALYALSAEASTDAIPLIPAGEHVAIIGKSGAGKTTLLKQLYHAFESAGTKVGMIEQSPYIFAKSLRENLLIADPSADDARLEWALEKVDLADLLSRLPDGLSSKMSEAGTTISGGERHRLALARILLSDCDTVLLDEPYKGLDPKTEDDVSKTLFEVFDEKTLVVVTHNLRGLERFDRVIAVGPDCIEADMPPVDLLGSIPRYMKFQAFETGTKNSASHQNVVYNVQAANAGC